MRDLGDFLVLVVLFTLSRTTDALSSATPSYRAVTRRSGGLRMSSAPITYKQVTLKAPKAARCVIRLFLLVETLLTREPR